MSNRFSVNTYQCRCLFASCRLTTAKQVNCQSLLLITYGCFSQQAFQLGALSVICGDFMFISVNPMICKIGISLAEIENLLKKKYIQEMVL